MIFKVDTIGREKDKRYVVRGVSYCFNPKFNTRKEAQDLADALNDVWSKMPFINRLVRQINSA